MKKRVVQRILGLALSAAMVLVGLPSAVYAAGESGTGDSGNARAGETIDVGVYAKIETDYVSGWENLNGVNNEAFEPSSSNAGNGQGWGNWSQEVGSSHYLQYTWDEAITTDSFQVYWYDDGGGTRIPGSMKFEYQDDSGNWQNLEMKSNFDDVLKLNQYNTIEVAGVTTKAIKFTMTVREGAAANGVYRWKVNAPLTDATADMALASAKDKLTVSSRMSSDTLLPSELTNGVKVTWTEDHPAITIENGKAVVVRGTSDVAGTMKAVLSLNGKTVEKSFNVTVPKKADEIPDMLAKYDFSDMTGSLADGSMVADLSGHDNNATVKGSGVTAADKALVLPGGAYGSGAGYVQLPTGMFDNQNNLTISMWIQNDQGAMWTSAFFFGNANSYFMINPQNPSTNKAKVCVTWGAAGGEIGIAPGNNLDDGPYTGSEWTHYIAVINENSITGYINGEKYNTYPLNNKISDMGTNLLSYIGKSEYNDPFFKGKVRNVSIYSKAMSDAEAGGLYTEGLTEEEIAKNAADALEIPEVKNGVLSTNVYDTVTLQKKQLSGLVTIDWKSDDEKIISTDGKVTAPEKNTKVKMTATVKVGAKEQTKVIEVLVLSKDSAAYSMTVDKEDTGIDISQELFGLFYEDINSSADGGLSPELVKNNSFQNYADGSAPTNPSTYGDQTSWKKYWTSSNASGFTVEQTAGLNEKNTNYAKLTGNQTLSNVGFTTMYNNTTPSVPIQDGMKYDFSMWMKADAAYAGNITVQVQNASGQALTDVKTLELKKDGNWNKISTVLTGNKKETGKLVLTISGAAGTDVIYADMISLASQDTYGYGNKNYAYGAGLRKDLVEVLADLNPSFIRFPGGCAIEGDYGPDSFYNWENSVGPLEERKAQASYWGDNTIWKNPDADYGYMMSFELGYHEILTLCEDLGAEAFPIMSAGIYCQFASSAPAAKKGAELDPYAQYAIDLLNYCWGDPDSSDPEQAKWAKKRVENGHEAPFDLHYVGIGNENWNTATVNYYENFTYIKNKIDAYKEAHYPDHQLQLIFAYGPYYWNASAGEDAYTYVKREMPGEVLMDEHYYAGANWMLENTHRYDSYDRLDEKGTDVFVGEYAVNDKGNRLEGAVAEAAYMTGFERNGDIVRHASYAPLLAKEGATNWSPNMIYFNEYDVMKTPNYYVQWMYANNYGKKLVNTKLNQMNAAGEYRALNDNQTDIYQVSSADDDYIYLKLVNHDSYAKDIALNYPGTEAKEAEIICMSGAADAENYMGNETIVPVTSRAAIEDGKMIYQIPAMSVTIVKVANKAGTDPEPVKVDKTKLQAAIDKAVPEADADKYTEETWTAYEKALNDAKKTIADEKADQKAVDAAEKALADAKEALKEKPAGLPFDDVAEGAWYYNAIAYNYYAGTMTGLKPDHFGPADTLVRAQFATVLHKMNGEAEVEYTDKFPDVTQGDWFKNPVLWAAEKEIVTGYTGTSMFGPNDTVTREQMATMMYRYAKNFKKYEVSEDGDYSSFPDAENVQIFARDAMKWAVKEGIITGKTIDGVLCLDPQGSANRAECATIIQRFMEKYEK